MRAAALLGGLTLTACGSAHPTSSAVLAPVSPSPSAAAGPGQQTPPPLAVAHWLPVYRAWVSPDGTRYAWGEYRTASGPTTGVVHVVDAATGADHPVNVPAASAVVSFEKEGIYVTRVIPNSGASPGGLTL